MFKRILVALDGSLQSQTALRVAEHLAQLSQSQVILVRSLGQVARRSANAYSRELRNCENYLRSLAAELSESGFPVAWEVVDDHQGPAADLLQIVQRKQPDLVVMTSHGRRGLKRLLHASVAEELIRSACCPVLVIGRRSNLLQSSIRGDSLRVSPDLDHTGRQASSPS